MCLTKLSDNYIFILVVGQLFQQGLFGDILRKHNYLFLRSSFLLLVKRVGFNLMEFGGVVLMLSIEYI